VIRPSQGTAHGPQAVVVGGSAGAITALAQLLPALPSDYPVPVVVVVHLPAEGPGGVVELFRHSCALAVKEAEDKEALAASTVYVAPQDYHVLVEKTGCLSLSCEEPVRYARPSIDVLFQSAADAYGRGLVAVVLSGANEDGADGVRAVCRSGGMALVQAPESAEMRAMPEAALEACPQARVLTVQEITESLCAIGGGGHVS
jgi:two-component system chemotaxis response regulator CheB